MRVLRLLAIAACVAGIAPALGAESAGKGSVEIIPRGAFATYVTWDSSGLSLSWRPDLRGASQPVLTFRGKFQGKNKTLVYDEDKYVPSESGNMPFSFEIPLSSDDSDTDVLFRVVDLAGAIEDVPFVVRVTLPEEPATVEAPRQRFAFTPALGVGSWRYQQTGLPDYTQTAVAVRLTGQMWISAPRWDLESDVAMSAVPLSSSGFDGSVRFLSANLRVGYTVTPVRSPWRLTLMAGAYYTTMFVTGNAFGYTSLLDPQFFPVLRRTIGRNQAVTFWVKYVPLTDDFPKLSLSSKREVAVGGGWEHKTRGGRAFGLTLGYSDLKFTPQAGTDIVQHAFALEAFREF